MKRSSLLLGALVMLICLFFAREQWTSIRGSLLADPPSPALARIALRIDPTNTGRTIRTMRILLRTAFAHVQSAQSFQAFTANCGTDACPPSSPSSDDFDENGRLDQQDIQILSASLRTLLRCGNGKRESAELCDDGNTVSFDGCSALCVPERTTHGVCMGTGMCTPMPGSGPDECLSNDDCMPSTSSSQVSSSEESSFPTTSSSDSSSSDTSSSDSAPPWMLDAERMTLHFEALPARTVTPSQKNVPLLRFRIAAKYMPVALTQLPFTIVGTNALYNIHDLRLMADTNGDGIVDTSVAHFHPTVLAFDEYSSRQAKASYDVYIGGLSLNDLSDNILVYNNAPTVFEVHADISSHPTTSSIGVSLDALRREPHALGAVADYSAVGMQNLTAVTILPLLNATIDSPCTFFTPMISSSAPIASCNIRVSTEQSTTTSFSIQPNL